MPVTYKKIASVTVGAGGASEILFSSIPSTYDDILVKISVRTSGGAAGDALYLRFNGDTGNNYNDRWLLGNGAAASSGSLSSTNIIYAGILDTNAETSSTFSSHDVYIPSYKGSTNKSVSLDNVSENNATTAYAVMSAGIWTNTSAVNAIRCFPSVGSFVQYSTAVLYGISKS